jgi:hypothetical protein
MAASLSVLRAGRLLPPEKFLVLIRIRSSVGPRAMVRLEGIDELKNPMASRIELTVFRLEP